MTVKSRRNLAVVILMAPLLIQCGCSQTELDTGLSSGGTSAAAGGSTSTGVPDRTSISGSDAGITAGNRWGQVPAECKAPADPGSCGDSIQRYYYDPATDRCMPIVYSRCGGNGNNFPTLGGCSGYCTGHLMCICPGGASGCSIAIAHGCTGCPIDSSNAGGTECGNLGLSCQGDFTGFCTCVAGDAGTSVWSCYFAL